MWKRWHNLEESVLCWHNWWGFCKWGAHPRCPGEGPSSCRPAPERSWHSCGVLQYHLLLISEGFLLLQAGSASSSESFDVAFYKSYNLQAHLSEERTCKWGGGPFNAMNVFDERIPQAGAFRRAVLAWLEVRRGSCTDPYLGWRLALARGQASWRVWGFVFCLFLGLQVILLEDDAFVPVLEQAGGYDLPGQCLWMGELGAKSLLCVACLFHASNDVFRQGEFAIFGNPVPREAPCAQALTRCLHPCGHSCRCLQEAET